MSERVKAEDIAGVDQQTGRELLVNLAKGTILPAETPPIYITQIGRQKQGPYSWISMPKPLSMIALGSEVTAAYEETGVLLFVPRGSERFSYRWVDIYQAGEDFSADLNDRVDSLRINPETGKFEKKGWFGPEQQPFMDYLAGNLEIEDPNTLPSFRVKRSRNDAALLGRVNNTDLKVNFKSDLDPFTVIDVVPRYVPKKEYFWIEGYKTGDTERTNPLFTRRAIAGESPSISEWRGPGIQSIVDWTYGKLQTPEVEEVEHKLDQNTKNSAITLEGSKLMVYLDKNASLTREDPIFLNAKEKGPYRWLEAQQADQEGTRRVVSRVLISASEGKPVLQGGWMGPERQALKDFIEEKANNDALYNFDALINSNGQINLFVSEGEAIKIGGFRNSAFNTGETVVLSPSVNESNKLVLTVTRPNDPAVVVAQATFERETNSFHTIIVGRKPTRQWNQEMLLEKAKEIAGETGDITYKISVQEDRAFANTVSSKYPGGWPKLRKDLGITQVDKTGAYQDEDGIKWAPVNKIAQMTNQDNASVLRFLKSSGLNLIEGRGGNGQVANLYPLDEALAYLESARRQRWTPERIRTEATKYLETHERIAMPDLKKGEYMHLASAIYRYYPGGINQLCLDMGLKINKRSKGYWTPENIEAEARGFIEEHGKLNMALLAKNGSHALRKAIIDKYPGQIHALWEKLGIVENSDRLSKDQANAALDSLFGGEL